MTKECNECKTELPDHAKYCLNCGKKLDEAPTITVQVCKRHKSRSAINTCASCGTPVCEVCFRKCGMCGKVLCPECFAGHKCGPDGKGKDFLL